jgi:hypothetical protein
VGFFISQVFISMKYVVTSEQVESLKNNIQTFIDYSLNSIREQSEEWGLGEMDELDEIDSIDKIVIDRIVTYSRLVVYLNIYQNKEKTTITQWRSYNI